MHTKILADKPNRDNPSNARLTSLLSVLAAEEMQGSDKKSRVLIGIWRQSGIPWSDFYLLYEGAIASQKGVK